MEILTLASGSSGNCYRVSDGRTPLLIECGIRFSDIRRGCGFKLSQIAGCLITHEHKDHCKAVKEVMKAGIDCYMSEGTARELGLWMGAYHRANVVFPKRQFKIGSWSILPFEAEHDAAEPLGFLLASGNEKLLFLTDSYYCRYRFKGLTHVMVECNYSLPILRRNIEAGLVSEAQKTRILRSHFSLENLKEFFQANDLSRVEEVHLIHLSGDNSDERRFQNEIQALTGKPVYVAPAWKG